MLGCLVTCELTPAVLVGCQDGVEAIRRKMSKDMKKSLKKGIAFVKKVRALGSVDDEGRQSLLRDVLAVNLKNHVDEVAVAMTHPNLKSGEIAFVVELASLMHQRYDGFVAAMMPALFNALATCAGVAKVGGKAFVKACTAAAQAAQMASDSFDFSGYDDMSSGGAAGGPEPEHAKPASSRVRTLLRLLWELFAAGVYTDEDSLAVRTAASSPMLEGCGWWWPDSACVWLYLCVAVAVCVGDCGLDVSVGCAVAGGGDRTPRASRPGARQGEAVVGLGRRCIQ